MKIVLIDSNSQFSTTCGVTEWSDAIPENQFYKDNNILQKDAQFSDRVVFQIMLIAIPSNI